MKRIGLFVISLHLILFLWVRAFTPEKVTEKKPLMVRTIVQAPAPEVKSIVPVKKVVNTTPPAQKVVKKSPPSKKPSPRKTVKKVAKIQQKQSSQSAIPQHLLRELQESIAKIDQKSHKGTSSKILKTPKLISNLKIDQESIGEADEFAKRLVAMLKNCLELPEMGEVKVEITLKNDGKLVKMRVLNSHSDRNQKFLEHELKCLNYPAFTGSLKKEEERPFVITFSSY